MLTQISVLMLVICELRFSVVPLHLPPKHGKRFQITCHLPGFYSSLTFTGQVSMFTSDEQISPQSLAWFYTYVYYIAQLITILLSGAGDGDDNKGKYRSFVRL